MIKFHTRKLYHFISPPPPIPLFPWELISLPSKSTHLIWIFLSICVTFYHVPWMSIIFLSAAEKKNQYRFTVYSLKFSVVLHKRRCLLSRISSKIHIILAYSLFMGLWFWINKWTNLSFIPIFNCCKVLQLYLNIFFVTQNLS